ncbi:unnamed protein product [Effrenium voratum]|nr:unnamed protein product [Effrenium voratum]
MASRKLAQRLLPQKVQVLEGALTAAEVQELLEGVQGSAYFGKNRSGHDFYHGTRGFSLVFRAPFRAQVEEHLPCLKPLFKAALWPVFNCYYLTLLYARPDGQRYHTDDFFETYCGFTRPSDLVSVMYLEGDQGELVLLDLDASADRVHRGREPPETVLRRVRPRPGRLVHFDGCLLHGVMPWPPNPPRSRVSAVIEQAKLSQTSVRRVPRFSVFCQRRHREIRLF